MDELIRAIGPLAVIVGLILATRSLPTVWKGWTTRNWSRTTGVLLGAKIRMQQRDEGDWSDGYSGPSGHFTYRYHAWVRYEYRVKNIRHQSQRIGYGIGYSDSNEMGIQAWLLGRRWKAGKQVSVFFNPAKPDQSVLIPGISWHHVLQLAGGSAIALAGVLVLTWSW